MADLNDLTATATTNCSTMMTSRFAHSLRATMTPAERRAGRFMRAPDGHGDAGGGGDAGAAGGEGDGAAAGSGVGEGAAPLEDAAKGGAGEDGEGEGSGAAAADPLDDKGILSDAEGAKPEGEGEEGKEGDGEKKEGEDGEPGPLTGDVPEAYTVNAPEGFVLDEAAMAIFDPVFRELTLTDAGAQKLVDAAPAFVEHVTNQVQQAQVNEIVNTRKEWASASLADPEIGGKNLERSKQLAASVFDRYGLKPDGPFRTLLNESGLANHPDMIRVFAKIGHDMAEDGFPVGEGAPKAGGSVLERLYPNDQPKK